MIKIYGAHTGLRISAPTQFSGSIPCFPVYKFFLAIISLFHHHFYVTVTYDSRRVVFLLYIYVAIQPRERLLEYFFPNTLWAFFCTRPRIQSPLPDCYSFIAWINYQAGKMYNISHFSLHSPASHSTSSSAFTPYFFVAQAKSFSLLSRNLGGWMWKLIFEFSKRDFFSILAFLNSDFSPWLQFDASHFVGFSFDLRKSTSQQSLPFNLPERNLRDSSMKSREEIGLKRKS